MDKSPLPKVPGDPSFDGVRRGINTVGFLLLSVLAVFVLVVGAWMILWWN